MMMNIQPDGANMGELGSLINSDSHQLTVVLDAGGGVMPIYCGSLKDHPISGAGLTVRRELLLLRNVEFILLTRDVPFERIDS